MRGIETLKQPASQVSGVARVALNLRGAERVAPARGMALVEPGRWTLAATLDVRLAAAGDRPPRQLTVHAGSARASARLRLLGGADRPAHPGRAAAAARRRPAAAPRPGFGRDGLRPARTGRRIRLGTTPLAIALVSASRAAWPPLVGATVLDVAPPAFRRRGAAAAAGRDLAAWAAVPGAAELLRRHGLLRATDLRAMGVTELPVPGRR